MKLNILTFAVPFCLLIFAFWQSPEISWTGEKYVAAVLICISLPLLALSRIQLGASFSIEPKARALVTRGFYSKIRNPIYIFGGLLGFGVVLFFVSIQAALVMAIIVIPVQILRARKEEKVLREAFGEEYARYKNQTWF